MQQRNRDILDGLSVSKYRYCAADQPVPGLAWGKLHSAPIYSLTLLIKRLCSEKRKVKLCRGWPLNTDISPKGTWNKRMYVRCTVIKSRTWDIVDNWYINNLTLSRSRSMRALLTQIYRALNTTTDRTTDRFHLTALIPKSQTKEARKVLSSSGVRRS